jgi:hypothetical protein
MSFYKLGVMLVVFDNCVGRWRQEASYAQNAFLTWWIPKLLGELIDKFNNAGATVEGFITKQDAANFDLLEQTSQQVWWRYVFQSVRDMSDADPTSASAPPGDRTGAPSARGKEESKVDKWDYDEKLGKINTGDPQLVCGILLLSYGNWIVCQHVRFLFPFFFFFFFLFFVLRTLCFSS